VEIAQFTGEKSRKTTGENPVILLATISFTSFSFASIHKMYVQSASTFAMYYMAVLAGTAPFKRKYKPIHPLAMSYIFISADFPETTPEQHTRIISGLEQKYWRKADEREGSICNAWYRFFPNDISEETAKNTAVRNFAEACNLYCEPRLIVHFGANKPSFHGYFTTSMSL